MLAWFTWLKLLGYAKKALPLSLVLFAGFAAGWVTQGWKMDSRVSTWRLRAIEEQSKYQSALNRWQTQKTEAQAETERQKRLFSERILAIETTPPEIVTRIETITERVHEISGECRDQVGVTGRLIAEMHGGDHE